MHPSLALWVNVLPAQVNCDTHMLAAAHTQHPVPQQRRCSRSQGQVQPAWPLPGPFSAAKCGTHPHDYLGFQGSCFSRHIIQHNTHCCTQTAVCLCSMSPSPHVCGVAPPPVLWGPPAPTSGLALPCLCLSWQPPAQGSWRPHWRHAPGGCLTCPLRQPMQAACRQGNNLCERCRKQIESSNLH